MEGWIKINRSLLDWEWYSDTNCVRLALHFLLKANYRPKKWHGITIERGQLVTTRGRLSEETGLSQAQVRTTMDNLQDSRFITKSTTSKCTIITICNYDLYQQVQYDLQPAYDQHMTSERPANDQQIATTKEYKKERIEEYNTHTVVSDKGVVGGNDRVEKLLLWVRRNCPVVASMPAPINSQHAIWMLNKYTSEEICRVLRDMEANEKTPTKKDAYSMFEKFASLDFAIKERRLQSGKLYTYEEMCDEIPSRAKQNDFERVEIEGRALWRKITKQQ